MGGWGDLRSRSGGLRSRSGGLRCSERDYAWGVQTWLGTPNHKGNRATTEGSRRTICVGYKVHLEIRVKLTFSQLSTPFLEAKHKFTRSGPDSTGVVRSIGSHASEPAGVRGFGARFLRRGGREKRRVSRSTTNRRRAIGGPGSFFNARCVCRLD